MNSKKFIIIFLLLIFSSILLYGCKKSGAEEIKISSEESEIFEIEKPEKPILPNMEKEKEEEEEIILKEKTVKSLINGIEIDEEASLRRPLAVMLDNHYGARPQAGLKDADIIYEILAEGRITRYIAIFQSKLVDSIGPIRSARPYYISRALEYDPIYVHVGGSEQAKRDIRSLNMAEVDGLSSGSNILWREKHKRIPHNMYSSSKAIYQEANRKKYRKKFELSTLNFNENLKEIGSEISNYVKITYKKPNSYDKIGYYVEFRYDEPSKKYFRYVNGKKHIDEIDKSELMTTNIIIQYAKHRVIDNEGRREISLIGEGKGYYISMGRKTEIKWKKPNRNSLTRYFDSNDNEISLNPGVIWIEVIPNENELEW